MDYLFEAKKAESDNIEESTIYNDLYIKIANKVKDPSTFKKFLKTFQYFMNKNDSKLNTNIMGRQVIFSSDIEDSIFSIFGVSRSEVEDTLSKSKYLSSFKKDGGEFTLASQLTVAIPLILASLAYRRLKKYEESEMVYMFAFFKPYASRISFIFKYGVNEDQMLYTIERTLTDRFFLKTYKTILLSIKAQSKSSYDNYITEYKNADVITDKELQIIFQSGIATRMNHFIERVSRAYAANKGKSLGYDLPAEEIYDKDDDSSDYEDSDIQSDTAVKTAIINKVITKVTGDPVDMKLVTLACKSVYTGSASYYIDGLANTIGEITEHMFKKLPEFFSSLIGSFLFHRDPSSGRIYTMTDFKTPLFLRVGVDILAGKKSHLSDVNMLKARELLNEMVEKHSEMYQQFGGMTSKRNFKKALAAYWVYLIKSVN